MRHARILVLFVALVVVASFALVQPAVSGAELSGSITLAGSTSVQPLADELAAAFMAKNRKVKVNVQGGGSGAGIKGALEGTCDIGMSSRELKPEETGLFETIVARDGIAVVVHRSNPVSDLSLEQIQGIYAGRITNWSQVGGKNQSILVVTREEGSGTRGAFEEIVMGKAKIVATANVQPATGAVRVTVAGAPQAIGYVSLGALTSEVKAVRVGGVEANAESIIQGRYRIQRPFLFLTRGKPEGLAKAFIDFCLSPEGQEIVAMDYIRVR
ncbi:MAG: phosphate ABC transporter substrate-binding protein [Firmicutes bacterium]|jgi:phosphate transport system substrate-binding protein|nr:phosphate ABC transporter substrate-binding protein [Bacillota bacterium]